MVLLWFAIVSISSIVCWLAIVRFIEKNDHGPVFVIFVGLSALGAAVGIIGGLSRVGVAGEVIAASLGLLGAVAVWLFAADRSKGTIVSACTLVFAFSLFVGYMESASRRSAAESYVFWRKECLDKYSDPKIFADATVFAALDATIGTLCARIFRTEANALLK